MFLPSPNLINNNVIQYSLIKCIRKTAFDHE